MRRLLGTVSALGMLAITACHDPVSSLEPGAPDLARSSAQADGDYIIVFNQRAGEPGSEAAALTRAHGGQLRFVYRNAIRGFAARGLNATAAQAIARNPVVAYVEPDAEARLFTTQNNATWGIDRIDQRNLPLSTSYTYNFTGSGVNAYIFDTGIRKAHNDFGGRVQYAPNGASGDFVGDGHGSAEDCHGHGTHVAGTVGGTTYGAAKNVNLWAGRVVNCSGGGNASMLIAALDWCDVNCVRPAVVNMSLGYGNVQSIRDAVEDLSAKGVTSVAAAGNGDWFGRPLNACSEAPAGAPSAITVGATSSSDAEASFSNYGTCVDVLAPGVSVTSAWYTSNTATNTISGTSMATPHVVGAVALYLSEFSGKTPQQVSAAITGSATPGKIALHSRSQKNGTPNLLLYTLGFGGGGTTNNPPTAAFTYSCTGLACSFNGSGSTDSDGTIATYAWTFGDGSSASGATANHTYAAGNTYTVTLTVTDNGGLSDNEVKSVTVSSAPSGGLTLSATGYKVKGVQHADLTWSGATSTSVDVFRNGAKIVTTANDGAHTDNIGSRGGGSYTYKVCEAGTSTCSSNVTVTF